MVEITCKQCKKNYSRWPYEVKSYKNPKNYICVSCKKDCRETKNCQHCKNIFISRKRENKIFCSKSCSASYNNKLRDRSFYFYNKTKKCNCKICRMELMVSNRACPSNVLCTKCKKQRRENYRKANPKKKYFKDLTCTICNKKFQGYFYDVVKTCSDKCRSYAKNGVRTYQNGSRKPSWYFCKEQEKDVLLESSWEVEIAKLLDQHINTK